MLDELLALPQTEDVWIAGAQPLSGKAAKGGPPPWLLLVQSRTQHFVLGFAHEPEQPTAQEALDALVGAMFEPAQGEPRRPTAVEMGPNIPWGPIGPMLEQIGVELREATDLGDLETAFRFVGMKLSGG